MRYHDVIYLIKVTIIEDELGNQIPQERSRMIFANQYNLSASEYYQASNQGLKPEKAFQINTLDYQGEEEIGHDGVSYTIIRTQIRGDKMILTAQRKIANVLH
jgi:hypothetical protein